MESNPATAKPGEEEDEAARAVRSILGQEAETGKKSRSDSTEEANKENSVAASIGGRRSSARLVNSKPDPSIKSPEEMVRAIKRSVGCVEVQYVEAVESRLDAPGILVLLQLAINKQL